MRDFTPEQLQWLEDNLNVMENMATGHGKLGSTVCVFYDMELGVRNWNFGTVRIREQTIQPGLDLNK